MSDDEQLDWVSGLGRTRERQIVALTELLRHSRTDEMSREDRIICRAQLHRLHLEQSGWRLVGGVSV